MDHRYHISHVAGKVNIKCTFKIRTTNFRREKSEKKVSCAQIITVTVKTYLSYSKQPLRLCRVFHSRIESGIIFSNLSADIRLDGSLFPYTGTYYSTLDRCPCYPRACCSSGLRRSPFGDRQHQLLSRPRKSSRTCPIDLRSSLRRDQNLIRRQIIEIQYLKS